MKMSSILMSIKIEFGPLLSTCADLLLHNNLGLARTKGDIENVLCV